MKWFSIDSKFMQALNTVGDYILLNVLYIIFCIPIITIGAARSAMYRVMFEMLQENGALYKRFCKTFFRDFLPSTLFFLLKYLVVALLAWFMFLVWANAVPMKGFILMAQLLALLVWLMVFANIPAQICRFNSRMKEYLHNALYITLTHPLRSLACALLDIFPLVFFLYDFALMLAFGPVFLFFYFSVSGNLCARMWEKPFAFYIEQAEQDD